MVEGSVLRLENFFPCLRRRPFDLEERRGCSSRFSLPCMGSMEGKQFWAPCLGRCMGHVAAEIPRPWTQISLSRPVPACRTSYESSLRIFGSQPLMETNGKMVSGVGVRGQGFRVEGWGETRVGFRVEGRALGIYAVICVSCRGISSCSVSQP